MSEPLKVLVTGVAGQIAYSLVISIAKGDVFGPDQPVHLVLLDIPIMKAVLDGVVMELMDCALPLLTDITALVEEPPAFKDIDVACLVGAMPRKEGMERKDLLAANVKIFKSQGKSLDTYAKKTVKVVVVGNPANTNAFIAKKYAPSIPAENFSCLTRLDQNRGQAQIAGKLGVPNKNVSNVIIWGNHSSTQFPDVSQAKVKTSDGVKSVQKAVGDDDWLNNTFISTVQKRGAAVIAARKLSSAMSAAKAVCDHLRDWFMGTKEGTFTSMGIVSDGSYNIPAGLVYSFPLKIAKDGSYKIVQDIAISDFARQKMDATKKELEEERDMACSVCEG
uniref:Malate dehydrogenase, cytoplasmic n=1 Tax=Tegula montereyi TaxID=1495004 RepID=A0A2K9YNE8_9VEST|nr:cytosolic malate dehydrogenase [Tegula montereyi]